MYRQLSSFTPDVVDELYGINTADPTEKPLFVFLLGTPGAGKSSGHPASLRSKAEGYATINLDSLLESLRPFRVGSSAAWWLAHAQGPEAARTFSGLPGYQSRRENVSSFGWWERLTPAERTAAPPEIQHMVKESIDPTQAAASLLTLNEAAIERAILKSVNVIYETTATLNKKDKRVKKVDTIMSLIKEKAPQYHVEFVLVDAVPEDVEKRMKARQEYNMPYREAPFWRRIPTTVSTIGASIRTNAEAFEALKKQYGDMATVTFRRIENHLDPTWLTPVREFNADTALKRIQEAYGPQKKKSSRRSTLSRSRSGSNGSRGSSSKRTRSSKSSRSTRSNKSNKSSKGSSSNKSNKSSKGSSSNKSSRKSVSPPRAGAGY